MKRSILAAFLFAGLVGTGLCGIANAQTTRPASGTPGSIENPNEVTSSDRGPDIDPVAFANSRFSSTRMFRTFEGFTSACYAIGDVWVYADKDDAQLYRTRLDFPFPGFYKPSWGEVFDIMARQMKCKWSWNPANRQFKFYKADVKPNFGVKLADGWRMEDRGLYVWHAPKDQDFGLDIYCYGHYTADPGDPELFNKIRGYFAVVNLSNWPTPPTEQQMTKVKIGEAEALFLKTDTPNPGGVLRQWSLMVDGNAFVIVSAMPKAKEAELIPAIEQMVSTFKMESSATTKPSK